MKQRKVNRLNDFFFKNLMGDEKRSNLTLRFLKSNRRKRLQEHTVSKNRAGPADKRRQVIHT